MPLGPKIEKSVRSSWKGDAMAALVVVSDHHTHGREKRKTRAANSKILIEAQGRQDLQRQRAAARTHLLVVRLVIFRAKVPQASPAAMVCTPQKGYGFGESTRSLL